MNEKDIFIAVPFFIALPIALQPAYAFDFSLPKDTPRQSIFQPKGGCTEDIIS
jgi:hypothetical protein